MYDTTLKDNICQVRILKVIPPVFVRKRPIILLSLILWLKLKRDKEPIVATMKYGIISKVVNVVMAECQNKDNKNNNTKVIIIHPVYLYKVNALLFR